MSPQTSPIIQAHPKQFLTIHSYYQLCSQLLSINQLCLRYLPASTPPFHQTFSRLLSIPISQRQTRQQIALHLASAYYSTLTFERETYLESDFKNFISKLRQIPPNIKLLLALQNTRKPVNYASLFLQTHSRRLMNNQNQIYSEIITPKQIIQNCTSCINSFQKITQQTHHQKTLKSHKNPTQKQQIQYYLNQKQFLLDSNLTRVIEWKYKACVICSFFLLEKQAKKATVNFIKLSKNLIKAGLIDMQNVVKVYIFCLNSAIKRNQASNQINQEHIYFQLQLNKIIHSQTQLSQQLLHQIQSLTDQIKLKTKQSLYSNPQKYQTSNPITKSNHLLDQFHPPEFNQQQKSANTFRPINKSQSTHRISLHNQFLSKFKTKFNFLIESESLKQIKQYQISLRKEKLDQSQRSNHPSKTIAFNLQKQGKQMQGQKHFFTLRNKSSQRISQHVSKKNDLSLKIKTTETHSTSTWRRKREQKTPSRIYLTIKDNVSKQIAITVMGLQNQMFMAPQFLYEKPKVTFDEILNDARSFQQRQNDSQSIVLQQNVNETYLQTVEIDLKYLCLMNEEFFQLRISKVRQSLENFKCLIWSSEYSFVVLEFEENSEFSLKTIKNSIEATDLFFELMQANIKTFKHQPVLKQAMIIKNLKDIQNTDQLAYCSQMTCLNTIVQITNYIKPYIYWYFTKRNKINGCLLQKRQKIDMSDPLKFSINLEFFKKNDFSGCIHLFRTVRNKKGLRQSLIYLSQGRQILCKRLVKFSNQYFIQVAQLNPKYLKKFQIDDSMQLMFPTLKIDVKKYGLTDEYLSKQRMIIEKAFEKMFQKALKKKQKKYQDQNDSTQKINMKHIFTNDQCNKILINNLNKNFIEKRLVIRLIDYLSRIQAIKQSNEKKSSSQESSNNINSQASNEKTISQKEDHYKLEVRLGLQSNPDKPDNVTSALKSWVNLFIENNNSPHLQQHPQKSLPQKQQAFTENVFKNELIVGQRINKKLKNYNNFLIHIIQNYESSFLVYVEKQYQKRVKLDQRFFSLSALKMNSNVYILLIHSNSNFNTWVFYLSQKLLRNFDYLMFNTNPINQQLSVIKSSNLQFPQQNNIKIKVKPATSLQYKDLIDPNKITPPSYLSINSMKQQEVFANKKIDLKLFPLIFNDQSETFQLCLMKTAFYNSIAIRRRHTHLYLTNLSSKNNPFSVSYNVNKVMMKKMAKCSPLDTFKKQYIYFACSLDDILNLWRIDIYRPSNQEKYLVIVPRQFFIEQIPNNTDIKKLEQTKEKYTVFWRKIINQKKYQIDFTLRFFSLNSNKFILYETFGRLTLPPTVYADKSYYQRIQSQYRESEKGAYESIGRRKPDKIHFSAAKSSGVAELLKESEEVRLILLNYEKKRIFSSEIEENPLHIFQNIFAEQKFKESKHFMYQNLFRRLFQKLERNSIVLNPASIDQLAFIQQ